MKKKLSIGFFTASLAAFIILAAAYHFTYERAVDRAREEMNQTASEENLEQNEETVTTEGDASKEDCYYLMEVNGYVVVFLSDKKTAYDYTSIEVSTLPTELQNEVKNGKYIEAGCLFSLLPLSPLT